MIIRVNGEVLGDIVAPDMRHVLTFITRTKGAEALASMEKIWILLRDGEDIIPLTTEVISMPLEGFDEVIIEDSVRGNDPFSLAMAAAAYMGAIAPTTVMVGASATFLGASLVSQIAVVALTLVIGVAESMVMGLIMQAISPTPEIKNDPANAQTAKSNLFNIGTTTKEQGGPVPLAVGNPYCAGTLIYVSLDSVNVKKESLI